MPLRLPAKGGADFEKVPPGTHVAICNMIVDVGLQPGNAQFAGVVDKDGKPDSRGQPSPKIYFRFEVPGQRMSYTKDGVEHEGPMTIYANYRASLNKKANLRKAIESFRGRKFANDGEAEAYDVFALLGQACMILVTHSEDGKYANIDNIMALPSGVPRPKAENPLLKYTKEEDQAYASLPNFLKEKVDGQLDPASAFPPPPLNQQAPRPQPRYADPAMSPADIAAAEQEASRQRALQDRGSGVDSFIDDPLPDF